MVVDRYIRIYLFTVISDLLYRGPMTVCVEIRIVPRHYNNLGTLIKQ